MMKQWQRRLGDLVFLCVILALCPDAVASSPPTVVWLEAEESIADTFDDVYPAQGLSGGRGLHFSTESESTLTGYTARYQVHIPQPGRYVLWSRRHLYYYDEGRIPLINRLNRYVELWWRIDGGGWRRPVIEANPVGLTGPYPNAVGHLGFTRTGDAETAGKYIGWYLDSVIPLSQGEHVFEVTVRLRQTTFTPIFQPRLDRYYGLLDAFVFAESGWVPNGRLRPLFAVDGGMHRPPVAIKTGQVEIYTTSAGDTLPNLIGVDASGLPGDQEYAARIQALRPGLGRICHIYNLARVDRGTDGRLTIDWTELDRLVDYVVDLGIEPLMCLSYTPAILSTMPPDVPRGPVNGDPGLYPPSDYAAWEEVVYRTVYHFNVERGLNIRYWEVWNEPNNVFWRVWHIWPWMASLPFSNTFNNIKKLVLYCRLYEHAARGAIRADASILIGGPTALCDGDVDDFTGSVKWWTRILTWWCDWRDIRLDFIPLHLYAGPPDSQTPDDYADLIRKAGQWATRSDGFVPEIMIDEWNAWSMEGGHDNATVYHAIWVMDTLDAMMQAGARHSVYHAPAFMDMFEPDRHTPRPTYNLLKMVSRMEPQRLLAQAMPADTHVIASRSSHTITVLIWRFGTVHRDIQVTLSSLDSGTKLRYRRMLLDEQHGNIHAGVAHAELEQVEEGTLVVDQDGSGHMTVRVPMTSATLMVFEREDAESGVLQPGSTTL